MIKETVPSGTYEAFEFQNRYEHSVELGEQVPASSSSRSSVRSYAEASVEELEQELLHTVQRLSNVSNSLRTLYHLIYERHIRPQTLHYNALLLINVCPRKGSAANVKAILQEMIEYNVSQNDETYRAVLQALAIHPDVEILHEVLKRCQQQYIDIDIGMLHLVVLCYLRADMVEIAMDYFERLFAAGRAETWLYVIIFRSLVDTGDWEAVMRMCYRLQDDPSLTIPLAMRQIDVPYSFWNWLLQEALKAEDINVLTWIWKGWVLKGYIIPGHDTCVKMMKLTAEHNDLITLQSALKVWDVLYGKHSVLHKTSECKLPPNLYSLLRSFKLSEVHRRPAPSEWSLLNRSPCSSPAPYYTSFTLPKLSFIPTGDPNHSTHDPQYLAQRLLAPAHHNPYHGLTKQSDPGASWPRIRESSRLHARWLAGVSKQSTTKHKSPELVETDKHDEKDGSHNGAGFNLAQARFEELLRVGEERRARAAQNPFEGLMKAVSSGGGDRLGGNDGSKTGRGSDCHTRDGQDDDNKDNKW